VRRNTALALAAAAGAAVGTLLARRRRADARLQQATDERAEDLRRKLAEARAAGTNEDDFEAAGSGAETVVEEPAPPTPPAPPAAEPAQPREPPPADEFEAMRRRIHEEGRAAAEEMRRAGEPPPSE
jgi:membrane-bound lytic murein transglycosylase B